MRHTGLGTEQHLEFLLALDAMFLFEKQFTIGVILMVGSRIRFLPYEFSAQGREIHVDTDVNVCNFFLVINQF